MKNLLVLLIAFIAIPSFAMSPEQVLACGSNDVKEIENAKNGKEVVKMKFYSASGQYNMYLNAIEDNDQEAVDEFEMRMASIENCDALKQELTAQWQEVSTFDYSQTDDFAMIIIGTLFLKEEQFKEEDRSKIQSRLIEQGFTRAAEEIKANHSAVLFTLTTNAISEMFNNKYAVDIYAAVSSSTHQNEELSALFFEYFSYDSEGYLHSVEGAKEEEYYPKEKELLANLSADEVERLVSIYMANETLTDWYKNDIIK